MQSPTDNSRNLSYIDAGLIPYNDAWRMQEQLREARMKGEVGDTIIFCEHPPVFTLGKQDCNADWLSSSDAVAKEGIEVVHSNRGGRITYHGPGQLVVYFIVDIKKYSTGVKDFVSKIEDMSLELMNNFGLKASKNSDHPGIWIGDKKIVAIGLHISGDISMHGIAINVHPNISHYRHIIPCGIKEKGITSMKAELSGKHSSMNEIKDKLSIIWGQVLNC